MKPTSNIDPLKLEALLKSMAWQDVGRRTIDERELTVRRAAPSAQFWQIRKESKEALKLVGLHASKEDGTWHVEHLIEHREQPTSQATTVAETGGVTVTSNLVGKLSPGESEEICSPCTDSWTKSALMSVEMVPVEKLRENPLNQKLYDCVVNPAILESVEQHGVKVPLRALPNGMLIDGHQRLEAAKAARCQIVPVIYVEVEADKEIDAILTYNSHRIKNTVELLREYRAYLHIEKAKAHERTGARTDKGSTLPEGHREWGKSRDLAAKKVGLGGSTAERGLRVLEEIERRSGTDLAEEARKRLVNQGVDPAFKYAHSLGWIESSVKEKVRKRKKAPDLKTDANESDFNGDTSSGDDETQVEALLTGWMTDDLINDALRGMAVSDDVEAEELRKTISYLRPRLYMVAGTTPAVVAANKLRSVAKALEALADKYAELASQESPR